MNNVNLAQVQQTHERRQWNTPSFSFSVIFYFGSCMWGVCVCVCALCGYVCASRCVERPPGCSRPAFLQSERADCSSSSSPIRCAANVFFCHIRSDAAASFSLARGKHHRRAERQHAFACWATLMYNIVYIDFRLPEFGILLEGDPCSLHTSGFHVSQSAETDNQGHDFSSLSNLNYILALLGTALYMLRPDDWSLLTGTRNWSSSPTQCVSR